MKTLLKHLLILVALLAATHAYAMRWYSPSTGRWFSRDPAVELSFQKFSEKRADQVGLDDGNPYHFVVNAPISNTDYLGLWVVCCRAGDPAPDDGFLVGIILPHLRHCEIQEKSCPDSKWTSYPITVRGVLVATVKRQLSRASPNAV